MIQIKTDQQDGEVLWHVCRHDSQSTLRGLTTVLEREHLTNDQQRSIILSIQTLTFGENGPQSELFRDLLTLELGLNCGGVALLPGGGGWSCGGGCGCGCGLAAVSPPVVSR